MIECECCGRFFDDDDVCWSDYYGGWVCEECYQKLVKSGKEYP